MHLSVFLSGISKMKAKNYSYLFTSLYVETAFFFFPPETILLEIFRAEGWFQYGQKL